jgi:hypothetical protein
MFMSRPVNLKNSLTRFDPDRKVAGMGWRVGMGLVCYRCPTSGEEVTTAIETGDEILAKMRAMDLTIWAWCPHCMEGHQIKPSDASLENKRKIAVAPSFAAT